MEYTATQVEPMLESYIEAGIPAWIWGSPGIGKSDLVRKVAAKLGLALIDKRAVLSDPVDVRGLPTIDNGKAVWLSPDDLPNVERDGEHGILFLDELNAAPMAVQNAFLQLTLDRKIGEYTLPDGWQIVAAGNRHSDNAGAQRLSSALANRFAHVTMVSDVDAWIAWAIANNVDPRVVAFLRFRPACLAEIPTRDTMCFATPRSWSRVAKLCDAPSNIRFGLVAGLLGDYIASEFCGFLRIYETLPDLAEIARDPDGAPLPYQTDVQAALCDALARWCDASNVNNVGKFFARIGGEFEALFWHLTEKRDAKLIECRAYVAFQEKDSAIELAA